MLCATPALLRLSGDAFAVFCACASLLGPLTVGLGLGFTGSTIDTMRNSVLAPDGSHIDIGSESNLYVLKSTTASSLFSAALTLGALIGTLSGGPVAEATGRRLALLIAAPLSVLAYLGIALGHSPYLLVVARLVAGFSMGICSFVSSVYISEVSPNKYRGFLGACTQLMMAGGITLVYAICLGMKTSAGSLDPLATSSTFCNWRLVAFICIIPPGMLFCLMMLAVESPRWLATRGRLDEARSTLVLLRGDDECDKSLIAEMDALEAIAGARGEKKDSLKSRLSVLWSCKRQAVIAIALNGLTQFTGLNALAFYQTTFFLEAGLDDADILALTVQLSTVIANVVACFLMDRVGRRPLLISSSIGMCISQLMIGTFFYIDRDGEAENLGWLILLGSYCYQITYAWGVGPIRWMVAAELFPDEARGLASSLATTSNWFCAFLFILFLDSVIKATSLQAVFYFFACVAALMTAFEWYMVPETKGKTLEEIQSIFS
ncbi:hypothetical protein FOL47_000266 [Perkinsus chesapeaki]|uniref:Hexose transporter 1 n=1 Tax=Perkinsus chesapeaki TaxID=330153 RepID=A0A7J6MME1_PERCH|nr:hypothetical protein FOL47_000266 [Perkinsus chesapeaki]